MFSRRDLCALAGLAGAGLATGAMAGPAKAQDILRYGPHPNQSLRLIKGRGLGPHPLVVMTGRAGHILPVSAPVRQMVALGLSVALVERREGRHGFRAHQSDLALAIAGLMAQAQALSLNGQLALWGQGEGADTVLLMLRDRRYLSAVSMTPQQIMGAVLVDAVQVAEPTFTQSSVYGLSDPPAIFRTTGRQAIEGVRFVSGLL